MRIMRSVPLSFFEQMTHKFPWLGQKSFGEMSKILYISICLVFVIFLLRSRH